MTGSARLVSFGALCLIALGWGITTPLSKIAVSTGYMHFGLVFWQLTIGALVMALVSLVRGKGLPRTPRAIRVSIFIALLGTIVPNSASYAAVARLPAGVMSILISMVPMFAFPIALGLGLEKFDLRRLAGLGLGLAGTLILVLPEASLPDPAMLLWVPVALVAPLCYAFEGNYVARWGTAGLDPIQLLFGACLTGAVLALPLALGTGQFISPIRPLGAPEAALLASSVVSVLSYTGYVWLVGRAGPVFAVQVSYLVTGIGVLAAVVGLGEPAPPALWLSLILVLGGMFLVQPRRQRVLAEDRAIGENAHRAS